MEIHSLKLPSLILYTGGEREEGDREVVQCCCTVLYRTVLYSPVQHNIITTVYCPSLWFPPFSLLAVSVTIQLMRGQSQSRTQRWVARALSKPMWAGIFKKYLAGWSPLFASLHPWYDLRLVARLGWAVAAITSLESAMTSSAAQLKSDHRELR